MQMFLYIQDIGNLIIFLTFGMACPRYKMYICRITVWCL